MSEENKENSILPPENLNQPATHLTLLCDLTHLTHSVT